MVALLKVVGAHFIGGRLYWAPSSLSSCPTVVSTDRGRCSTADKRKPLVAPSINGDTKKFGQRPRPTAPSSGAVAATLLLARTRNWAHVSSMRVACVLGNFGKLILPA